MVKKSAEVILQDNYTHYATMYRGFICGMNNYVNFKSGFTINLFSINLPTIFLVIINKCRKIFIDLLIHIIP